jgi:formate-dependent nitrite reductase membrane component NrfD
MMKPDWFSEIYGIACACVLLGALVALGAALARRPLLARRLARASLLAGVLAVVVALIVFAADLLRAQGPEAKASALAHAISQMMTTAATMLPAMFLAGAALRFSARARR